ncbi:MAG: hypothetical protein ACOX5W_06125 [Bacillota bacterium]
MQNSDSLAIVIALLFIVGICYYFYIANTVNSQKKRIIDLLVIGAIIWLSPVIEEWMKIDSLKIVGFLIFAYGWGILIGEKFLEGLNEEKHEK